MKKRPESATLTSHMARAANELDPLTLEALVEQACRRTDYAAAAALLIEHVGPKIVAFLAHRLGNPTDTAEVFSMFSEDLWRALPAFEWRCTVRGYCFALARSAAVRYRLTANERFERRLPLSRAPISELAVEVRERTLSYLRTETKSQMQALFRALPEDDRALLQLRLDQGLSFRDLAIALEFDGAVPAEAELTRAATRLRKRFQVTKDKLRDMALQAGLVGAQSTSEHD